MKENEDSGNKIIFVCFLHLYLYFSELLDNRFRPQALFSTSKYLWEMYLCMYSSLQKDSGIQGKGSDGVKEGKKDGKRKEDGRKRNYVFCIYIHIFLNYWTIDLGHERRFLRRSIFDKCIYVCILQYRRI